jgi:hypothetical protein
VLAGILRIMLSFVRHRRSNPYRWLTRGHFWLSAIFVVDDLSAETVHFLFRGLLLFQSQHFLTTALTICDKNCQRNFVSVRALFRNYAHGFIVILAATSDCVLFIRRKLARTIFWLRGNRTTCCKTARKTPPQYSRDISYRIFSQSVSLFRLMLADKCLCLRNLIYKDCLSLSLDLSLTTMRTR